MGNTPLFQFLAHHPGQGADGGLGNVRHPEGRTVQLIAGTHAADDGGTHRKGPLGKAEFSRDSIDGIHNIIILCKIELIRRFRGVEDWIGIDHCIWINVQNAFFGHLHLQPAHSGMGSQKLAVDIGDADGVAVN